MAFNYYYLCLLCWIYSLGFYPGCCSDKSLMVRIGSKKWKFLKDKGVIDMKHWTMYICPHCHLISTDKAWEPCCGDPMLPVSKDEYVVAYVKNGVSTLIRFLQNQIQDEEDREHGLVEDPVCSCGSKHTSNPNYHLGYCDLNDDKL